MLIQLAQSLLLLLLLLYDPRRRRRLPRLRTRARTLRHGRPRTHRHRGRRRIHEHRGRPRPLRRQRRGQQLPPPGRSPRPAWARGTEGERLMPDIRRAGLWYAMAESAGLTNADGTIGETIYGQMTKRAAQLGAVNLGQGAPGSEPPTELIDATTEAMRAGFNQYAPGQGFPQLLEAVAAQRERDFGQRVDPAEVLYTAGATEGL